MSPWGPCEAETEKEIRETEKGRRALRPSALVMTTYDSGGSVVRSHDPATAGGTATGDLTSAQAASATFDFVLADRLRPPAEGAFDSFSCRISFSRTGLVASSRERRKRS
ncbi:MAG: hypothetical protein KatS3mg008_1627 [Acidimicrobiales bacterium]|nr:MAG: hypothetical protein KatS3mg008_1627 [Acidimicrobiales bacterium]